MRKMKLLRIPVIYLLAVLLFYQPVYAQQVHDSAAISKWATLLENGKKKRTSGIVCMSIGAAFMGLAALSPKKPETGGWGSGFSIPPASTVFFGLSGFVLEVVGVGNLIKGTHRVHKAKVQLGNTSYYMLLGRNINGPSLAFQWQLGK